MNHPRNGLRIRTDSGVHPEVRRACLKFGGWLRTEHNFPIRVVVYLKKDYRIKNRDTKQLTTATFLAPFDKNVEPYIRVATGDLEMVHDNGQDNALAAILGSIAHELGHYFQWLDDQVLDEEDADDFRMDDFKQRLCISNIPYSYYKSRLNIGGISIEKWGIHFEGI